MRIEYSYLGKQFENIEEYISDIRGLVKSGEFTLGPYVERFEKMFAEYVGTRFVISTNTGTDALILGLRALGVGPGDEVITVPNSFYATVGAIVAVGARPVFADCDERFQIDAHEIEKVISKKTKAILPVHWTGASPEMDTICSLASKYNLHVIEDACPAVGAKINGKAAGTFGTIGAFSMHPLKPLNVWGDGGMIATDSEEAAKFLSCYRNHGMVDRDNINMWGVNARVQPIQAVVAMRQLKGIEKIIEIRNRNAAHFDEGLSELKEFVRIPTRLKGHREAFQLYIIECDRREELLQYLWKNEIEAKIHYPIPLHLQPPGRELGYKEGDFPNAEAQAKRIVTLPSHQHLSDDQIQFTVDTIKAFYKK